MLTPEGCERRQSRLLRIMEQERWDLFLTSNYRTVYYLTGSLSPGEIPTIFVLWRDGSSVLITSSKNEALASEVIPLETYSIQRAITQPMHDAASLLRRALEGKRPPSRCGVERTTVPGLLEDVLHAELCDAAPAILRLRKRKEHDEIDEIRASLKLIETAYRTARDVIAEGRTEIDVYNDMQAAVVREAGTFVQLAGDFACGERAIRGGGPPTNRTIAANDLYILDLFPAPALYFGDTCRTFTVREPTDLQYRAFEIVREAVRLGEAAVKPGVPSRQVYTLIKDFLDSHELTENSFWHHAGHGIGHHGHEAPRIIRGCDDIFEVGDVITLEPGVYTKALHGGIRLEDNYVVHEHGLENLVRYPMEL